MHYTPNVGQTCFLLKVDLSL